MELDLGSAIWAGLVATLVMTVMMYIGKAMTKSPMDMPRMLGLMFTGPEHSGVVYTMGLIVHFMFGTLFGILYGWLFSTLGVEASWLWGGIFGFVHGIVAGFFIGMMPTMHPRMGPGKTLPSPGPFGKNYGSTTPMRLVVLHIVFGIVLGWIYTPVF